MSVPTSAVYRGEVVHQRHAPRRHRLRYDLFQMLFDLDELPELGRRLRLFSHNRFNVFSFHDADHGDGAASPRATLRVYVEGVLASAGLSLGGGRIALLCMPRLLGHVFNPLSVYYCHRADGTLGAIIYEVNNTFGQRHSYVIPAAEADAGLVRQACDKDFYVSPFMDMDMRYHFRMSAPGETISTIVEGRGPDDAPILFASFAGRRAVLSDRTLLGVLFAYPFQTLGVVAAIHWEAVKLLAKGIGMRRRPPPPAAPVTVVAGSPGAI